MNISPLFGAILIKPSVIVQVVDTVGSQSKVENNINGGSYFIPTVELNHHYDLINRYKKTYISYPQMKDVEIVGPDSLYPIRGGGEKKAKHGVLVREIEGNCFYEWDTPFYGIGFKPAPNPDGTVNSESQKIYDAILQKCNIFLTPTPRNLMGTANSHFSKPNSQKRRYRIAIAGFSEMSQAPEPAKRIRENVKYERSCNRFLNELIRILESSEIGFVTSPTTHKYSIDAITSILSQRLTIPIVYTTAEAYLPYINPSDPVNFDTRINYSFYVQQPKYFFKSEEQYSKATARISNCCLILGGRQAAISDAVNALQKGNKVIIYDDLTLPGEPYRDGKVQNASRYLKTQYGATTKTTEEKDLPLPMAGGLTAAILRQAKARNLIKIVTSEDLRGQRGLEETMLDIRAFLDTKVTK